MTHKLEDEILKNPEIKYAMQALMQRENGLSLEECIEQVCLYVDSVGSAVNPFVMLVTNIIANHVVTKSFSNVYATGSREALEVMREGNIAVVSSHSSYLDVAVIPRLLAEYDIGNVFYMGGENVPRIPHIGSLVNYWLLNSGFVPIKRSFVQEREMGHLYVAVIRADAKHILGGGKVLVNFSGRGRQRHGFIEPVNLTVTPSILEASRFIAFMTITYETFPEALDFALNLTSKGGANIGDGFKLTTPEESYGSVYVNFGSLIETQAYMRNIDGLHPEAAIKRFHEEATDGLRRLVTLTPKSALSTALLDLTASATARGKSSVTISDLVDAAGETVGKARAAGVSIAYELAPNVPSTVKKSLEEAAWYFINCGALNVKAHETIEVADARLPQFYANHVAYALGKPHILLNQNHRPQRVNS